MEETREIVETSFQRLQSGETNIEEKLLDIKKQWHHVSTRKNNSEKKEEFCKDICAMANSCYPSSGYIIFGLSTTSPYIFESKLPMDEASLQQQIMSGISPAPDVKFIEFDINGTTISVAVISSSLRKLPHVARYKSNLWIPWMRQGSSTKSASHLDLVSIFDYKEIYRNKSEIKFSVQEKLKWAGNYSVGNKGSWNDMEKAPKGRDPLSGFSVNLRIANVGTLQTALTNVELEIEFDDNSLIKNTACYYINSSWPVEISQRSGVQFVVILYFKDDYASIVKSKKKKAKQFILSVTDIDDNRYSLKLSEDRLPLPLR